MQISQIQVAQDSPQDRLLLRILSQSNEEIRVHLTRRFLRELWPHLLTQLLDHSLPPDGQPALPGSPQAAPSNASFEQPFKDDNPIFPLGSNPLLASEAVIETAGPGLTRLTLREGRERHFNFNLNGDLLQAFCAMLRAGAQKAQWDLKLEYAKPEPKTSEAPGSTPTPQSRLH